MSNVAWNEQRVAARLADSWRPWEAGRWNLGTTTRPRQRPAGAQEVQGPQEPAGPTESAAPLAPVEQAELGSGPAGATRVDALWHQVARGEDWAALIARYNVPDPGALLEANGLQAPRPLVPGEWVCVPCDLARPVWELDLNAEREGAPDGE